MKFLREYAVINMGNVVAYFNNEEDAIEYATECKQRNKHDTITVYKKIKEVIVSQEDYL